MISLNYFEPWEFGAWWEHMSAEFLWRLDQWRGAFGFACEIPFSGREGALGREYGSRNSQHYFDRNNPRRLAVADVQPYKYNRSRRTKQPLTREEMRYGYELALSYGFTGVGVYPEYRRPMFHLDCRPPRSPEHVATWGMIYQRDAENRYALNDQGQRIRVEISINDVWRDELWLRRPA